MIALRSVFRVRAVALALFLGLLTTALPHATPRGVTGHAPASPPATADEVRALWVLRTSLTTPHQIARVVRDARDSGFNTLLVQVRGRGDAYFLQGLEPRAASLGRAPATFDPLAHTLKLAHAAGLRVHAWVNVNLVSSAVVLPRDPTHVVNQHPEWLMVPKALARELAGMNPRRASYVARLAAWSRGRSTIVEGLYTSPVPPEAARHVEAVVSDLARRYAIDGLHLDYVRYPAAEFDYSAASLAAFRASVVSGLATAERARLDARLAREPAIYADSFPERWANYRRARLTDLVARLRAALRQHRPQALVSAAVVPDSRDAAKNRLQDWQDWAARGLLDVICPMAYTADVDRFSVAVHGATRSAAPQALWAGIGAYRLDSTQTVAHIEAARAAGAHGVALFSYDSLTGPALRSIGRTAFGHAGVPVASTR